MSDIDEKVESSATTETVTEEVSDNNASNDAETGTEAVENEPSIPLSRFQEVNGELKTTREQFEQLQAQVKSMEAGQNTTGVQDPNLEQVKKELQSLGFVTKEEQQAELERQKNDAQLEQELTQLEGKFDGKDGMPKFNRKEVIDYAIKKNIADPLDAFKLLKEKEIIDYQIQQAVNKTKGVKAETSDGSGSSQIGTSEEDLKSAIADGDKKALRTYLKGLSKSS